MISRLLFYGGIFLFLFSLETGFLSAFPSPWSWLPILPAVGLWFIHQKGSVIGLWYILWWGIGSDILHRNPWGSQTVIATAMIVLWASFASRLFSTRSIYGFLAFIVSEWLVWFLVQWFYYFISATPSEFARTEFFSFMTIRGLELAIIATGIFWIDVRIKETNLRL